MSIDKIIIIAVVVLLFGIIIFPLVNRKQFCNLPYDQKIRVLMKEANGLAYFKNVSKGSSGDLYFVKNKRKILVFPWVLSGGKMICTKKEPFSNWDYPEDKPLINSDELLLIKEELEKYNNKKTIKIEFYDNEE